jgi:hypothetical protein
MLIPRGDYLTVKEYRKQIGYASCKPIYSALKDNRLQGINLYGNWLILRDAIIMEKKNKSGEYISVARQKRIQKALAKKLFADESEIDI